jgi:hypothetical protein
MTFVWGNREGERTSEPATFLREVIGYFFKADIQRGEKKEGGREGGREERHATYLEAGLLLEGGSGVLLEGGDDVSGVELLPQHVLAGLGERGREGGREGGRERSMRK